MAFGNLDPNTDAFTSVGLVWPTDSQGGISYQKLNELAKNSSYNYRRCDQRLFLFNEQFGDGQELDYDTAFDYDGSFLMIIPRGTDASQSSPFSVDISLQYIRFMQLSTTYAVLATGDGGDSYFDIRALAGGGIRLRNTRRGATRYLSCLIMELRQV